MMKNSSNRVLDLSAWLLRLNSCLPPESTNHALPRNLFKRRVLVLARHNYKIATARLNSF
jgi:hypothetical protein